MTPSQCLQGLKKKINLYHYCTGAEKVILTELLEGKWDTQEQPALVKKAVPAKAKVAKVEGE